MRKPGWPEAGRAQQDKVRSAIAVAGGANFLLNVQVLANENENVGSGKLQMPQKQMHTTSCWLTTPREVIPALLAESATGPSARSGIGIRLSGPPSLLHDPLIAEGLKLIENGPCFDGCWSRVGPAGQAGPKGQEVALHRLRAAMSE